MLHVSRAPKLDLAAVLASQNPQIDLKLDAYEASTRNFLKAVSNYTQRALTEIANRKTNHIAERKKLSEKIQHIETETNACKVKEIELIAVLEREQEEKREAEASVAGFRRQLAVIREKCAALDTEIEQNRLVAANLHREHDRDCTLLDSHASHSGPELTDCERKLRCMVEGIDKDRILIRFTHIDPADLDREFSMVMDLSDRSYRVPTTTPFLPMLPILLEELNSTRDFYTFIKHVRHAFLTAAIGESTSAQ
ncbi:hypothetical protein OBBRIDRAFT_884963 [Obba rivulosa]|uniref:Kinetochore protein SPC25 n=1 Tax=Obba rivulosa TaxID=1052685 RepID=A0A8E2J6A0_9APHY|nr:hypothetical protein OBBRIDRAFT_884963 [Obba rivulosa]